MPDTNKAQPTMLIDVLRHGEPVGGARYRGKTDDVLTEQGWQQMMNAVKPAPPWTRIISSPLRRCSEFAAQLGETLQLELHIEPRLAEIDFGDWEGLTSQQIMARDADRLLQYWNNPGNTTPPNGEPLATFKSRVTSAWHALINEHFPGKQQPANHTATGHRKEHLLVVTHGGTLRMILSNILEMPHTALFNIDVPYACLSRFRYQGDNGQPQLIFHNSTLS